MTRARRFRGLMAVVVGLAFGLALSGFWPQAPLYAVATDRIETFGMATGPLDQKVEAVYLLDFLTGDLRVVVLGEAMGTWGGYFQANVAADLGISDRQNPKFLMVTGMCNLRRAGGSRLQPSAAMCYVAETTTGQIAAYTVPWSPSQYAAGQLQTNALRLVSSYHFRQPMDAGSGSGARSGRH
jgi:hypothetical protein